MAQNTVCFCSGNDLRRLVSATEGNLLSENNIFLVSDLFIMSDDPLFQDILEVIYKLCVKKLQ